MLKTLTIQNLATIEALAVEFSPGLNALTGETGAGKSVLVGGLGLALGERAANDVIRAGESLAVVEAVFEGSLPVEGAEWLTGELAVEWSPGEPLALRRELTRSGRNRCFINSQMVGVAELKRLGELLIDFHGQHEHQSLFRPAAARVALDAFAGNEAQRAAYHGVWGEVSELRRRQQRLEDAARDFDRKLDYLNYQLQEIEKLKPHPGELAALEQEERRLASADELSRAAAEGYALLYEGLDEEHPAVLALLREVARRIAEITDVEEEFAPALTRLEECKAQLEDLALELRDYGENVQADPRRLDEVIARIEAIRRLVRKHGGAEDAMFAAWKTMKAERDQMQRDDADRETISASLSQAETRLLAAGAALTASRKAAAERFGKDIIRLLHELRMEKARFVVTLEPLPEPGPAGLDAVDFLLAANPGLPPAPLRKVASGGEISRVMLALKSALAARDAIPTLVFDEIDVGISGETARRVGWLMERLAATHQVLCITHHAPIAARAARHASVRKRLAAGATFTDIVQLDEPERLEELARMMGGDGGAEAARELARQLMA